MQRHGAVEPLEDEIILGNYYNYLDFKDNRGLVSRWPTESNS